MCQIRGRGLLRGCLGGVYLADNVHIGYNGPVVWGVAVCVGVGMRFCKVPVSGQDFRVMMKLSRWLSPDKWYGVVTAR